MTFIDDHLADTERSITAARAEARALIAEMDAQTDPAATYATLRLIRQAQRRVRHYEAVKRGIGVIAGELDAGRPVTRTRGQQAEHGPIEPATVRYADGTQALDVDTTWLWNGSTL